MYLFLQLGHLRKGMGDLMIGERIVARRLHESSRKCGIHGTLMVGDPSLFQSVYFPKPPNLPHPLRLLLPRPRPRLQARVPANNLRQPAPSRQAGLAAAAAAAAQEEGSTPGIRA